MSYPLTSRHVTEGYFFFLCKVLHSKVRHQSIQLLGLGRRRWLALWQLGRTIRTGEKMDIPHTNFLLTPWEDGPCLLPLRTLPPTSECLSPWWFLHLCVCGGWCMWVYKLYVFLTKLQTPFVWNFISHQPQCFQHPVYSMNATDWLLAIDTQTSRKQTLYFCLGGKELSRVVLFAIIIWSEGRI